MKTNLILTIFWMALFGQAQNNPIVASKIDFVPNNNKEFIGRDQYGYHYFVANQVLFKQKKQEHWEYKNISLGALSKVDLTNPLKIILFYENFNTIVLLDNQLNETKKINFSEGNIPMSIIATGLASQNQLWIYNRIDQQLGLFDFLKNSSRSITTPFPESFLYYQTDFNNFYWIDDKKNAFVCNWNGKISRLEKINDFDWLTFIDQNQYLYQKDQKMYLVDYHSKKTYTIDISEKRFKKAYYKDQILSIFTTEGISNYKLTIP